MKARDLYQFKMSGYTSRVVLLNMTKEDLSAILKNYLDGEMNFSFFGIEYLVREAVFTAFMNEIDMDPEHEKLFRLLTKLARFPRYFKGDEKKFEEGFRGDNEKRAAYARRLWVDQNPNAQWLDYSEEEFLKETC